MKNLNIKVVSYSLSLDPSTLREWEEKLRMEFAELIKDRPDVILYPELFLAGLGKYFPDAALKGVAHYLTQELLPKVTEWIKDHDTLVVLGSSPREENGHLYNSAPIYLNGKWHFQDKLYLTPWETDFTPGNELKVFEFKGLATTVVICFDSEQPDLCLQLKKRGVDLVLVPSATTNLNGSQRVNRCASARAVELGACVITSPLVGQSSVDLVDHNEGRQGFFLPAQEDVNVLQEQFSEYSSGKQVITQFNLNLQMMEKLKKVSSETKPYHETIKDHLKISSI